jgi:UDP-glucose 4-epimerase
MKLKKSPSELEILGDGSQTKSYLHVSDCVEAMILGLNSSLQVDVFNVGSEDQVSVRTIAEIVVEEMDLENVDFKFTGGVDGGRGWKGDVKNMLLDVSKLKSLGWKPKYNSEGATRLAVRELIKELASDYLRSARSSRPQGGFCHLKHPQPI